MATLDMAEALGMLNTSAQALDGLATAADADAVGVNDVLIVQTMFFAPLASALLLLADATQEQVRVMREAVGLQRELMEHAKESSARLHAQSQALADALRPDDDAAGG